MKLTENLSRFFRAVGSRTDRWARAAGAALLFAAQTLLAPIGFREVLLLGGAAPVGYGASFVFPPAAFMAPGVVLVGVAVFGVRA